MPSSFVIAAPSSGSGKTSLSLGLMQALIERAFKVQSFKCGPDYIDTLLHSSITTKPGINLDLFFNTSEELNDLYDRYAFDADVNIIEGVMGLFDGFNKAEGSTASIAKTLHLPVILIVDAKATAYSIAPILYGFKNFDTDIEIAGVIFNRVGSEGHYQYLKEAADEVGLISFGYIPNNPDFQIPERYLGLNFDNQNEIHLSIKKIAEQINKTVDINLVLETCPVYPGKSPEKKHSIKGKFKIAVSKDEAFTFTYHENIQYLSQLGEIVYFSPLKDNRVPDADFVYLSGGYPEKYLQELSSNNNMIASIKDYVASGGKLLAECGGMMYLGKHIIDEDGNKYPMTGVFDFDSSMQEKKLHLGYRKWKFNNLSIKGHEFHYSNILNDDNEIKVGEISSAHNIQMNTHMYRKMNCYASYMHLYWKDNFKKLLVNSEL